jgi:hypothetical protein
MSPDASPREDPQQPTRHQLLTELAALREEESRLLAEIELLRSARAS